jgi:hypothetical protein
LEEEGEQKMAIMSEEERKHLIEAAVAEHKLGDETLRLPWQNSAENFPVVNLPVEAVVLNPHSHRIRAQLESHKNRLVVEGEPFSQEAQELISCLLREEEGYEDLKTSLSQGQRDAGVITRAGLLVNANRRVVALRESRERYVRVAVLPPHAIQEEIDQLELRLQVARDYRMDYTFTNQLLFVDELQVKYNRSPDEASLALGWASSSDPKELRKGKARVEQATRLLRLIREIQHRSGSAIPLIFFDAKAVAIEEIDKHFEGMRRTDERGAIRVRDTRILGLIADVQYRSLRQIDEAFLADYLLPAIEDSEILKNHIVSFVEPSLPPKGGDIIGLDVLEEENVDDGEPSPVMILEALAKTAMETTIILPRKGAEPAEVERALVVDDLRVAFERAADDKKRDDKTADRLAAPSEYLKEADRLLKRALEAYRKVHTKPGFNNGKFFYLMKRIRKSFDTVKGLTGEQRRFRPSASSCPGDWRSSKSGGGARRRRARYFLVTGSRGMGFGWR